MRAYWSDFGSSITRAHDRLFGIRVPAYMGVYLKRGAKVVHTFPGNDSVSSCVPTSLDVTDPSSVPSILYVICTSNLPYITLSL
jgi:hypothetical protein